mgnify:CR=1 FL=1
MTEQEIMKTDFGEWGDKKKHYLKTYHPEEWNEMLKEGRLEKFLQDHDDTQYQRSQRLLTQICEADGIGYPYDGRLPQMEWVGRFNMAMAEMREIMGEEYRPPHYE